MFPLVWMQKKEPSFYKKKNSKKTHWLSNENKIKIPPTLSSTITITITITITTTITTIFTAQIVCRGLGISWITAQTSS